jgi:hypothetical protein
MPITMTTETYEDGYLIAPPDPLTYPNAEADHTTRDQLGKHERRMFEAHGYRRLRPYYVCPRWIVGKRHLFPRGISRCVCGFDTSSVPGIWDHARAWRTPDGGKVITLEPYQVHEDDLAAYRQVLAPFGLRVRVAASSQWYRGWTHLLIIEAAS